MLTYANLQEPTITYKNLKQLNPKNFKKTKFALTIVFLQKTGK